MAVSHEGEETYMNPLRNFASHVWQQKIKRKQNKKSKKNLKIRSDRTEDFLSGLKLCFLVLICPSSLGHSRCIYILHARHILKRSDKLKEF